MYIPKKKKRKLKRKKKPMIKLTRAEINFLKGFSEQELDKYMIQFPQREKNAREFKRRYRWVAGTWRKKI